MSKIEPIVKTFRFYAQDFDKSIIRKLSYDEITFKTFYQAHKKAFDKLSSVFEKYDIDYKKFIRFAIYNCSVSNPEGLLSSVLFRRYATYLQVSDQYKKIVKYYKKSVTNIANICIERHITPKEFLKESILKNKLAYEYISGRISKYFIVSLRGFREIYSRLDSMNQAELGIIYDAADELSGMVHDAFLKLESRGISPIKEIEQEINKIKTNEQNNYYIKTIN